MFLKKCLKLIFQEAEEDENEKGMLWSTRPLQSLYIPFNLPCTV